MSGAWPHKFSCWRSEDSNLSGSIITRESSCDKEMKSNDGAKENYKVRRQTKSGETRDCITRYIKHWSCLLCLVLIAKNVNHGNHLERQSQKGGSHKKDRPMPQR